jgi:hypothetical protein
MPKHHHILPAASNLLGIALIIIAGLNVSKMAKETISDEVAWVAAVCLTLSCLFSYMAIRAEPQPTRYENWADRVFFAGLVILLGSVLILAVHAA